MDGTDGWVTTVTRKKEIAHEGLWEHTPLTIFTLLKQKKYRSDVRSILMPPIFHITHKLSYQ